MDEHAYHGLGEARRAAIREEAAARAQASHICGGIPDGDQIAEAMARQLKDAYAENAAAIAGGEAALAERQLRSRSTALALAVELFKPSITGGRNAGSDDVLRVAGEFLPFIEGRE